MLHTDITVEFAEEYIALITIRRPPNNFFNVTLLRDLADAYDRLAESTAARVIVLRSEGKHFSAGADLSDTANAQASTTAELYAQAVRLFRGSLPVIAAVHGAAVGGGLGLACSADFRVVASDVRLCANFSRLGTHQGFGLSVTLPRLVGQQRALELLYTGRRVTGTEAYQIGLADHVAPSERLLSVAFDSAREIARSGPLAVRLIRATLRGRLGEDVAEAIAHEHTQQEVLRSTDDFQEGKLASEQRRDPVFGGH